MDENFYKNIEQLLALERKNLQINSAILQDMMNRGIRDINQLDRVADRLLDTMYGLSGEGEDIYHRYLDYIATFDTKEANERHDDLEYDLGYKTHVLYASAILSQKELENMKAPDGRSSFQVVMDDYIPKVNEIKKKTASFLFFAYYANGRSIEELMKMLRTITEQTAYVLERMEEFDDLMHYPREEYHPLREDEWQYIQIVVEHNIELCSKHTELSKELLDKTFGNRCQ